MYADAKVKSDREGGESREQEEEGFREDIAEYR